MPACLRGDPWIPVRQNHDLPHRPRSATLSYSASSGHEGLVGMENPACGSFLLCSSFPWLRGIASRQRRQPAHPSRHAACHDRAQLSFGPATAPLTAAAKHRAARLIFYATLHFCSKIHRQTHVSSTWTCRCKASASRSRRSCPAFSPRSAAFSTPPTRSWLRERARDQLEAEDGVAPACAAAATRRTQRVPLNIFDASSNFGQSGGLAPGPLGFQRRT